MRPWKSLGAMIAHEFDEETRKLKLPDFRPDGNEKALEAVYQYGFSYPVVGNLLITGPNGSGKSHLAVALAYTVAEEASVIYATAKRLQSATWEQIQSAKAVDLLVIDDLEDSEILRVILQDRKDYEKPTIYTARSPFGAKNVPQCYPLMQGCQAIALQVMPALAKV